jgi:hypothetical protein
MSIKEHLAELERQHKALDHEIAEALAHSSTDDLKIASKIDRKRMRLSVSGTIMPYEQAEAHKRRSTDAKALL